MKTAVTRLSRRLLRVLSRISRNYSGKYGQILRTAVDGQLRYYRTLETINKNLDEITAQGRWKLAIFSDLNTTAVDGCLNCLSTALENFKVCAVSDIHGLVA